MELVSVTEGARELGIGPRAIRQAIQEGKLPAFRIGNRWVRVEREALHEWVRQKRVPPPEPEQ